MPFVVGASVGAPAFALMTWYKLQKRRRQEVIRNEAP